MTLPERVMQRVGEDVADLPKSVLRGRVDRGDCADSGSDDWFPPEPDPRSSPRGRARYEATARRLCRDCPVRAECLELALRDEVRPYVIPHGIFGGTAPWERKQLIRNRRRRAHAARLRAARAEGVAS